MSVKTAEGLQPLCVKLDSEDMSLRKPTLEEVTATINGFFKEASDVKNLVEKRRIYNKAFSALRGSGCPELRPMLYRLLKKYAWKTWYNQESEERNAKTGESVDDELGFRMCARLMELSWCMQMQDLGLLDTSSFNYDWSQHDSLEALTKDLQIEPKDEGRFFYVIDHSLTPVEVLLSETHKMGLQETMADTLTVMSFSYQNIAWLRKNVSLQRKLQAWTEAEIGNTTDEQKQCLEKYRYNRCLFMLLLTTPNATLEEKIACYEPIMKAFQECCQGNPSLLLQKEAQISNMRGCITKRSGQSDARAKAEHYFLEAYELYSRIPPTLTTKCLKGNAITSLIDCLAETPLDQPRAVRLLGYAKELREIHSEYKGNDDFNGYVAEYPKSYQQADAALEKYKAEQRRVSGAK